MIPCDLFVSIRPGSIGSRPLTPANLRASRPLAAEPLNAHSAFQSRLLHPLALVGPIASIASLLTAEHVQSLPASNQKPTNGSATHCCWLSLPIAFSISIRPQ